MAASQTNISNSNVQLPSLKENSKRHLKIDDCFFYKALKLGRLGLFSGVYRLPTNQPSIQKEKSDIGCFQK